MKTTLADSRRTDFRSRVSSFRVRAGRLQGSSNLYESMAVGISLDNGHDRDFDPLFQLLEVPYQVVEIDLDPGIAMSVRSFCFPAGRGVFIIFAERETFRAGRNP